MERYITPLPNFYYIIFAALWEAGLRLNKKIYTFDSVVVSPPQIAADNIKMKFIRRKIAEKYLY